MKKFFLLYIIFIILFLSACNTKIENSDDSLIINSESENADSTDNDILNIDWESFQSVLSAEDYSALEVYVPVLSGEHFFVDFDSDNQKKTIEGYFGELLGAVEEHPEMTFTFTLIDLDSDDDKEFVLYTVLGGGRYLILSESAGIVYGFSYSVREFQNLQKDGKFMGSGGAGDAYYYTLEISENGVVENCFGEHHGENDEQGNYDYNLIVNGEKIEDYNAWITENYSNPVSWYNSVDGTIQ